MVSAIYQKSMAEDKGFEIPDAAKIIGCWKGLAGQGRGEEGKLLENAVAFCSTIAESKRIEEHFRKVVDTYIDAEEEKGNAMPSLHCDIEHVDGTMDSSERKQKLKWLAQTDDSDPKAPVCHILSNARCLAEGIDVPNLDAVMFLQPKRSQIDITQAVGRVMRKFTGKEFGYIILPIVIPAGMTDEEALDSNEPFQVVWDILKALRSHDERLEARINALPYDKKAKDGPVVVVGGDDETPEKEEKPEGEEEQTKMYFSQDDLQEAVNAMIVRKCGTRVYWDDWAKDIAVIAKRHIERITKLCGEGGSAREPFERFLRGLRDSLNDGITEGEAIDMLAQHMITLPVFQALFQGADFAESNPVSVAMEAMVESLRGFDLETEDERRELADLYRSVEIRAESVKTDAGRQRIIKELYEKFFSQAFKATSEKMGIVYTPSEVVDYILHATDRLMRKEFGQSLSDEGVHILDPACGSGNFLTETYLCLRRLEDDVLIELQGGQIKMGFGGVCDVKVSIHQFYGIEINDFAVTVAKTALWIAEIQANLESEEIIQRDIEDLPLHDSANIVEGNALRIDWNDVLSADECDYVMGNPPFRGARWQTKEQKNELAEVFQHARNCGNVDYVSGWHIKTACYIGDNNIRCAFVSTNSICQGEQVANIWQPIYKLGMRIDFAHDTFRWGNEANNQAHVFVVIVGFSKLAGEKLLFHHAGPDSEAVVKHPRNINAYLADAPDVFIWNRNVALCDVPKMGIGNKPIDGGNYLFKDDEKEAFLKEEPGAAPYFHPWLGSDEFINGKRRWVLWLGDAMPAELRALPLCRERILAVRDYRLSSKSTPTRKLALTPTRFHVENMPDGSSVIIPQVSSERRHYIPMGFIGPETFCSDKVRLITDANLYHFGVLTSEMHNAWMRVVAGRLKSDYSYSGGVVYNNFIWPGATEQPGVTVEDAVSSDARKAIESCAQEVLAARKNYPDSSLADMYDPDNEFMFPNLISAHHALDAAVEAAYGVGFHGDEEKIVAHLFKLYAQLTQGE